MLTPNDILQKSAQSIAKMESDEQYYLMILLLAIGAGCAITGYGIYIKNK